MTNIVMEPTNKKKINKKSLILIIVSISLLITLIALIVYAVTGLRVPTYSEKYAKQINALKSWYQNEYQKEYNDRENETFKIDLSNYSKQEQDIINSYVNRNYEKYINNIDEIEKYYKYDEKSFQTYDYDTDKLAFDVEKIKSYKKDNIINQSITRNNFASDYQQLDTFLFENNRFKKYDYQDYNNQLFITRILNPRSSLHYETDYAYSFTNLTNENQYIIVRQNDFRLMFEENKNRYPELTNFVYGRSIHENGVWDPEDRDMKNVKWDIDYTSEQYWNSMSHTFKGKENEWFYQYKKQYVLGSATMGLRWHLLTDQSKYDTFSVINRTTQEKWNDFFPSSHKWKDYSLASDIIQIKPKEKIYLLAIFNQLPFNLYKVNTNKIYDNNNNWQVEHENMFDIKLCTEKDNFSHQCSNVQSKWNELLKYINYDRKKYKNHDEVIRTILNYLEFIKYGFRLMISPGYKSQFLNMKIKPYLTSNYSDFQRNILVKNKWKMGKFGWPNELKDNVRLYYSFHNINGLYEFYREVNLQIKNKFQLLIYFSSQNNEDNNESKIIAYTLQSTQIIDDYRLLDNNIKTITNYNINFNFNFDTYHKITPLVIKNKLRAKPINKWENDDFNYFFTLFDNKKRLYTEVGDENTVFYHEYTHILGQDHENLEQRLNMDQTAFGYLPVFSHEIIYI